MNLAPATPNFVYKYDPNTRIIEIYDSSSPPELRAKIIPDYLGGFRGNNFFGNASLITLWIDLSENQVVEITDFSAFVQRIKKAVTFSSMEIKIPEPLNPPFEITFITINGINIISTPFFINTFDVFVPVTGLIDSSFEVPENSSIQIAISELPLSLQFKVL